MTPEDQARLLEDWFQFAVEDALVIDPDCINAEAIGNMCTFSQADRSAPAPKAVADWIRRVAAHRATQLHGNPMTLYCWHDAQARQLRISVVSTSHRRLPFGCVHVKTLDIGAVVREIITHDWRNPRYGSCQLEEDSAADAPFYSEARPLMVGLIRLG